MLLLLDPIFANLFLFVLQNRPHELNGKHNLSEYLSPELLPKMVHLFQESNCFQPCWRTIRWKKHSFVIVMMPECRITKNNFVEQPLNPITHCFIVPNFINAFNQGSLNVMADQLRRHLVISIAFECLNMTTKNLKGKRKSSLSISSSCWF